MARRRRGRRRKKKPINRYRFPYVLRKKRRGPKPIPKEKRKRPTNAFQKFSKKERIKIRKQRPNITVKQMATQLRLRWRRLSYTEQMNFMKRKRVRRVRRISE
ncbi:hypothetical protein B4U80_14144 [Leptotrombidium deliense]|uniref:HMG box domain-containing protein n=1 Tax=Leptotrombidium deliense TaxID=299467 RepID=A0A443S1Q0_9ACAR|nr:hypothetical protein B4U80_14144 [Leptotrombidium deliense]